MENTFTQRHIQCPVISATASGWVMAKGDRSTAPLLQAVSSRERGGTLRRLRWSSSQLSSPAPLGGVVRELTGII